MKNIVLLRLKLQYSFHAKKSAFGHNIQKVQEKMRELMKKIVTNHYGAEISGQLKSLQLVAGLTSERDGEIRKAALNTLATAYKHLGWDEGVMDMKVGEVAYGATGFRDWGIRPNLVLVFEIEVLSTK
ncbi:protein MOR1-like isoform X2 [Curcuma longa]|uniref:protein MOR1-like isoform X2 n=1 Tax=Curcuma longa TaxID=136217 RepID=UPI003D9E98CD